MTLLEGFLNDKSKVLLFLFVFSLVKVHKHRYKRSLTVGCEQGNNLILNSLNASVYFLAKSFFNDFVELFFAYLTAELFNLCDSFLADFLP